MAVIKKFKVIKMACFLGLFGIFMGFVYGIILTLLSLIIPAVATFKVWQMIIGIPIAYGIMMFLMGLIFTPLMNLSLRVIKGIHLDLDLTESTSIKKSIPLRPTKKLVPIKPVKKQEVKPVVTHPIKSTKDSRPISQMTNSKTTQNSALKTSIKSAV